MSLEETHFTRDRKGAARFDSSCHLLSLPIALGLLLLVLFVPKAAAQYKPWSSGSPLVWSDFQGTPPPLSTDPEENHDAYVYTEILWDFDWDSSNRTLNVNAQAVFVRPASWYRPTAASPALLSHEEGHFDYAEVSARQLKQRIAESVELKDLLRRCDVTETEIEALLTLYHAEEIEELEFNHGFYDSETDHGQFIPMQNAFEGVTIPNLLSNLNTYTDPIVSVTVDNEGAVPVPGNYEGVLRYTLQAGPTNTTIGTWNWTVEGQWNFTLTANTTGGDSAWNHHYTNNQYGGHLINVTMPPVAALASLPVLVQDDPSGTHFWIDVSSVSTSTMASHELTMAPVTDLPVALPSTPPDTTLPFASSAALALGNWMREQGTTALMMRAPITCPNESILYRIDMGAGQFFEFEWTLTRIAETQSGSPSGGAGGSGSSGTSVSITSIMPDVLAGTMTLTWDAPAGGISYLIETSEDLENWTELDTLISTGAGSMTYIDSGSMASMSMQFYRITVATP